ncbi:MAG: hypothetical protein JZU65_06025 [Chlorobium sp.]|nr:hypothetical protein [Chlorobium sp.]
MSSHVTQIISAIRSLQKKRYPNLLINQKNGYSISDDEAKSVAAGAGLQFIDFRDDILGTDKSIVLGAYTRTQFQGLLNYTATQNSGIFLWNADTLITTWDVSAQKAFFREFLLNGVNYGPSTVIESRLATSFELEEVHNGEIKVLNIDKIDLLEV